MIDKWEALRRRLVREAHATLAHSHPNGQAIIRVTVLMSGDGDPIFWVVPRGLSIEPSMDARDAVLRLLEGMGYEQD